MKGVRHTNIDIKRILISSGVFVGVLLVMCFTVVMIKKVSGDTGAPTSQNEASADSGKTAENKGGSTDTDVADITDVANSDDAGANLATDSGSTDTPADNTGDQNNTGAADNTGIPDDGSVGPEDGNNPDGGDNTDNVSTTYIICIDAAHQAKADTSSEPIGPGASSKKYKCTSGATGVTGALEYELNLAIAVKLRDELLKRGYGVAMIREANDVNISDSERAQLANETSSMVIHIHCNAEERENISGVMVFEPAEDNPFVDASTGEKCRKLGRAIVDRLADSTGAKKWGVIGNNNLTALNWTTVPAAHVEVGYLTNAAEEKLLISDEYQNKITKGFADGID